MEFVDDEDYNGGNSMVAGGGSWSVPNLLLLLNTL